MRDNAEKLLVVVGGGAAGMFCAVNAASNKNLKVIVLEKSNKLLSKVKISGGGRCNVTHACFNISEMAARYPRGQRFVKKTFYQFFTRDTVQWFEKRQVKLKTEADGRMFPDSDSSQTIIDCLLMEAARFKVKINLNAEVRFIQAEAGRFEIGLSQGRHINADFVTIACGGYPKSGMFDWLRALGHTIEDPVPSLFTFNMPKHPITKLMGVSIPKVQVKIAGTKLRETGPVLVTHWGLSGPAVLRLSAWGAKILHAMQWKFKVQINWLPDYNEETMTERLRSLRTERAGAKVSTKNIFSLPNRFWEFLLLESGISSDLRWADLPVKEQNRLIKNLCSYEVEVTGKTTFKEEFVTAGGVSLDEVDVQTMMSKKVDNLFFAGEVLNIDGITGGFNFQNAWTTGYIASKTIAGKLNRADK